MEIKALAGFLQATGWLCLYGVNLATSTPAQAAEEVAYAVSVLGSNLLGIEIGNEPDEYGIPGNFFAGNWTFEDYLARWNMFRSAILQSAPNVAITGPAAAGGNHITTWTLPFGQATTAAEITLLTQHYYRASGDSPIADRRFPHQPRQPTHRRADTTERGGPATGHSLPDKRMQLLLQRRRSRRQQQLRFLPVGD